jgi:hypothetical protein
MFWQNPGLGLLICALPHRPQWPPTEDCWGRVSTSQHGQKPRPVTPALKQLGLPPLRLANNHDPDLFADVFLIHTTRKFIPLTIVRLDLSFDITGVLHETAQ